MKAELGALLLGPEGERDLELVAAGVGALGVGEVLLEADVAPDGLHHAEGERVELAADAEGRDLVGRVFGVQGLEPVDVVLVFLEAGKVAGEEVGRELGAAVDEAEAGGVDGFELEHVWTRTCGREGF